MLYNNQIGKIKRTAGTNFGRPFWFTILFSFYSPTAYEITAGIGVGAIYKNTAAG